MEIGPKNHVFSSEDDIFLLPTKIQSLLLMHLFLVLFLPFLLAFILPFYLLFPFMIYLLYSCFFLQNQSRVVFSGTVRYDKELLSFVPLSLSNWHVSKSFTVQSDPI
jgi:hypothetical protein